MSAAGARLKMCCAHSTGINDSVRLVEAMMFPTIFMLPASEVARAWKYMSECPCMRAILRRDVALWVSLSQAATSKNSCNDSYPQLFVADKGPGTRRRELVVHVGKPPPRKMRALSTRWETSAAGAKTSAGTDSCCRAWLQMSSKMSARFLPRTSLLPQSLAQHINHLRTALRLP